MKLKNSITTNLIVVISGFFIIATYAPKVTWGGLTLQENLFLIRKAIFPDGKIHGVYAGEWWRVVTVVLTHANWVHLGFNMLVLFQLGNIVERFYGKVRYGFILFGCACAASMTCLLLTSANIPSVGASGMIFGLFGVILATGKGMGVDYSQVVVNVVLNLIFTFTASNIAWQAHLGGLVSGILIGLILRAAPRRRAPQIWE